MTTPLIASAGPSELQRVAFHEAGHAVIAHLRSEAVLHASIVPSHESLGRVTQLALLGKPTPRCDPGLRERVLSRIEILLAGPAAEAQRLARLAGPHDLLNRAVALFDETADGQEDLKSAIRLAKAVSFSGTEAKHLVHFLHRRVAGRFSAHERIWQAVEMLAVALVEHGELHGSHVHWVISRALAGRKYLDLREGLARRIRGGPGILRISVAARIRKLST